MHITSSPTTLRVRVNSYWISWDRISWDSYVYTEIKVQQYQMLLYIMREKCVERTSNHRVSSFISRLKKIYTSRETLEHRKCPGKYRNRVLRDP